jgi:predicted NBD/HSP70 family sugar kinase
MAIWRVRLDDDERRIMGVLRSSGARSRKDLAIHLGMSASKLTRLSGNLLAHGLIEECRYADVGTPGRPAVPLRISPTAGYGVGAMVHRGLMEVALVDYAGGVIAHRSQPFDDPDPYVFAARVTAEMHELAIANRLLGRRLLGVGIGVPGAALSSDGTRRWTVDSLAAWRGVDLKALFEEQIGHDVWIENDANAAALAEYYVGGLVRRCTTAVVILLGHGIGAGVIVEGRILRGATASAGEIGMLYPIGEPRPSTLDLLSTLQAEGCAIQSLLDFDAVTLGYEAVVAGWVDRAARQIAPIINWGLAWVDPGEFVISSPLPNRILTALVERIDFGAMRIGDHVGRTPRISVSTLEGTAATIGAALLPIHATAIA